MKANYIILIPIITFCASCASYLRQPLSVREAKLGEVTPQFESLKDLPKPTEPIVAAVYSFRDQTGQYKPSDVVANWSTAITQGATSILIQAMEESGWFIPIEREGLPNLLNERKIIRSSRAAYGEGNNGQPIIPPLLFAGIILEGGIISFDSNVLTGGAGARYFGAGGSGQYREDRITIYLRAVSTSNGKVVKSVYVTKSILSQKIDVNFFRFVKFQRLLEAETGFTFNEPAELAVKEAIEKAVVSLVYEGLHDELWYAEENPQVQKKVNAYLKEKEGILQTDTYGFRHQSIRGSASASLLGGGTYYQGDYTEPQLGSYANLNFRVMADRPVSLSFNTFYSEISAEGSYTGSLAGVDAGIRYTFFPNYRASPFAELNGGALKEISSNVKEVNNYNESVHGYIKTTLGVEYLFPSNLLGVNLSLSSYYMYDDGLDDVYQGKYNDYYYTASAGIVWYLWN